MDNDILIRIGADNNASPALREIAKHFRELRTTYEDARAELTKGGLAVPVEVLEKALRGAQSRAAAVRGEMAQLFDATMRHGEQAAASLAATMDRLADQEIAAQSRADAKRLESLERYAAQRRAIMAKLQSDEEERFYREQMSRGPQEARALAAARQAQEQRVKTQFDIAMEARRVQDRAQAEQLASLRRHATQTHQLDQQMALGAAEGRRRAQEITARGEERLVADRRRAIQELAGFEQRLTQYVSAQAEARVRIAQQEAARRQQALSGAASALGMGGGGRITDALTALGGMGGSGGFLGGVGSLAGGLARFTGPLGVAAGIGGGILGGVGNIVSGAMGMFGNLASGAVNVVGGALSIIPNAFNAVTTAVDNATSGIMEFVKQGLTIVGVYQAVRLLENAIQGLGRGYVTFQANVARIGALTVGGRQFQRQYGEAAYREAVETGRSPAEMAEAIMYLESHGYRGAAAQTALASAARLSASGVGTTPDLIRMATGMAAEYGVKAEDAPGVQYFFDLVARMEQASVTRPGELAGQLQRATPLAVGAGISPANLMGFVATMSQSGLPGGRVVTDTIAVMQNLLDFTPKAQKAMEKYGFTVNDVRKILADQSPEGGLYGALKFIRDRTQGDADAILDIFGDGQRAAVGFFSVMEGGGERYKKVLEGMKDPTGAVAEIWDQMSKTLEVQIPRIGSIIQAAFNTLVDPMGGPLGEWLKSVNDAFASGDIVSGVNKLAEGIQTAGTTILQTVTNLAKQMFGSGVSIIVELANGIISAASQYLTLAANYAADIVAGFLLGASWPKKGPLSYGDQGTQAWMQAKADSMEAHSDILASAGEHVAGVVNEQLAKIGGTGAAGSIQGLQQQLAGIDQQLLPLRLAADAIKDSYEAILHPLERQMEMLRNIKDLEYDRAQLKFRERDLELQQLLLRAEGDPARRAQLAGQMARQQLINERTDIAQQQAGLQRRLRELGRQRMSPQERALAQQDIRNQLATLAIRQQQVNLKNPQLMGEYAAKKAMLDLDKAAADLQHAAFELQRDMDLQPMIEQHDKIKAQMQAELDLLKQQMDPLEDQKKIISEILQMKRADEAAAKAAAADAKGGTAFTPPKIPIPGTPPLTAADLAGNFSDRIRRGFQEFANSPEFATIGQAITGAIVGGMVAGIPGAIAGAQFWPAFMKELEKRGVYEIHFEEGARYWWEEFKKAWEKARVPLTAGDLFGTWESFKQSVGDWIQQGERSVFGEFFTEPVKVDAFTGYQPEGTPGVERVRPSTTTVYRRVPGIPITDEMGTPLGGMVAPPGASRYTGIGRTIIEALFGRQDQQLNYQTAYNMLKERIFDPIWRAIRENWRQFTSPTISEAAGGMPILGPSPLQQIAQSVMDTLIAGFDAAISLIPPERLKGFYNFGKTIGTQIADGAWDALKDTKAGKALMLAGDFIGLGVNTVPGAQAAKGVLPHVPGIASAVSEGLTPGANPLAPRNIVSVDGPALGKELSEGIREGYRDSWAKDTSFATQNGTYWDVNVIQTAKQMLRIGSPSGVFFDIGNDVLGGFQDALQQDTTTAALVRMWARSSVIAEARNILIRGEAAVGTRGGLPGVADEAIGAMNDVFAEGVPATMQYNLRTFGQLMVMYLMEPIKDPNTGLAAQLRDVYTSLPRPPPPSTGGTTGGSGLTGDTVPNRAGERGASSWLDIPPQQTTSTPVNINVNSPLIEGVTLENGDDPALDNMLDRVRNFLVNDIRTARGQGVPQPQGVSPRGSR